MSASKKITAHLGKNKIAFEVVKHRKVYTAYDLAQTLGEKLENIAKALLIQAEIPEIKKKGKHYFVVVLPASYNADMKKIKKLLKAKKVDFTPEKAMAKLKLKPGAISPLGSVRGLGVVVDKSLLKTQKALIGAESFTESLRIKVRDLVKLEEPIVGIIGKKNKLKLQNRKGGKKKSTKRKPAKKKVVKRKVRR